MQPFTLKAGLETLLPLNSNHAKHEYFKIVADKTYTVGYQITWKANESTSCPLRANIYRVTKDYSFELLNSQVTVSIGASVNLNKTFNFHLLNGERVCLGVKNLSSVNFTIEKATFSIT